MSWRDSFLSKSPIKITEGETETARARREANMDFHKAEQELYIREYMDKKAKEAKDKKEAKEASNKARAKEFADKQKNSEAE